MPNDTPESLDFDNGNDRDFAMLEALNFYGFGGIDAYKKDAGNIARGVLFGKVNGNQRSSRQRYESELRIQHLQFEKDRLKIAYRKSMAECNDHIKNCRSHMSPEDREANIKKWKGA